VQFETYLLNQPLTLKLLTRIQDSGEKSVAKNILTDQTRIVASRDYVQQKIILASGSPRRAEILCAAGWPFEVRVAGIDESIIENENPVSYVKRLALAKAQTIAGGLERGLVLGADTTVVVDGEILGQPNDDEDAKRMLRLLSGRSHEVVTAVAFVAARTNVSVVGHRQTLVRFAEMSAKDISWYVSTGEPKGKAGAYAVQGKAALFIEEIQGDYFNVVGLPIRLVYELMNQLRAGE
jgi:septum formation protein